MKKFIQINEENVVIMINYFPFDEKSGMGMTEEELLVIGKLVDEIPNIPFSDGKIGQYIYNSNTNTVDYEYIDRPKTTEELQAEEIESLRNDLNSAIIELSMAMAGGV